ncbi:FGGY family carbohydrate kinase [Nitratireductor sp. StC3]|uniref:xylulokinase n=1 Tax=Nitratireductor sp. StC3 TaxID=2126741 RepID=UPI00130496C4|nr:FGGY family carbohydrate kinase [Nitratireductor sp. StC3]
MAETLTLGIDFGTSAVKAVALDAAGGVRALTSAAYQTAKPAPDRAEQDPQDWWRALGEVSRTVMAALGSARIGAIGLSGQLNGIVLVDKAGAVLRPGLIWLDQRCAEETAELELRHADRLAQTASSPISPIAVLPKLRWLARHEPGTMRRTARVFQVKDYILWRLTGVAATEANEASATLLMDLGRRAWADDLVELAGLAPAQLPPIRPSDAVAGRVHDAAACATGLPAGVPVVPGSGDTGALAVGCGAYEAGVAAVTLGTAGHVVAAVPNRGPGAVNGLWRMAHVSADRELWLGLIPAGGLSIAWLRNLASGFGGTATGFEALERLLAAAPAGSAGATFLPFLEGAGTPWNDPQRLAGLANLNVTHGAAELVRAVYEGVAFNVRACLDAFEAAGVGLSRIHLAEGGASSPAWCQIIADALDREVHVVAERDTSAVGAAILARAAIEAADLAAIVARSVRIERVHRPEPAHRAAMDAAWRRFCAHAGTTSA